MARLHAILMRKRHSLLDLIFFAWIVQALVEDHYAGALALFIINITIDIFGQPPRSDHG